MSTPEIKQSNLMLADQARKKALLDKKKRKLSSIVFVIPGILIFFACLAFFVYLALEIQFDKTREKELNKAIDEFREQPVPAPTVKEGRLFYYIWGCELYKYDIDLEKSTLISSNVEGYKDISCIKDTLFTFDQTIVESYDSTGSASEVYMFDFTSADTLTKLEVSSEGNKHTFAYDSVGRIAYQFVLNDAVYLINMDTKETDKLFQTGGFPPTILTDDAGFSLKLSPDRKAIVVEDTVSKSIDPTSSESGEEQEYLSVNIIGLDGKVMDSFQGKYVHWLDDNRVVYWPYKKDEPNLTIRNIKTKTQVEVLQELDDVVALSVDTKNSLIFVSTKRIDENGNQAIESHLYDNSTGIDVKLSAGYVGISYLFDNIVVGFNPGKSGNVGETKSAGIGILNVSKNESNIIIGE
ncbi:hypothetical protein JW796_01035 [Candidatus Dojkabacteria bacterium]|nr:hypothetical protein [Candidatus Dojkabacteria bacterium]